MTTNRWMELWADMVSLRAVRLSKLGRAVIDEEQPAARVCATLARAAGMALALTEESDATKGAPLVLAAWEEYLRDEWALSLTPPFALSGFVNTVMLSRMVRAAEQTFAAERGL